MTSVVDLKDQRSKLLAEVKDKQDQRKADQRKLDDITKPDSERAKKLEDERAQLHGEISDLQKRIDNLTEQIAKAERISAAEATSQHACIDGCTTWLVSQLVLTDVRNNTSWNGIVNAGDRTPAHVDDCGDKCSQEDLYYKRPGCCCNPANPPGEGSHEGVNGGSPAYRTSFAYGSKLPPWAWGHDITDSDAFLAGAASLGYHYFRPYSYESWHVNAAEDPLPNLRKRGLIG